MTHLPFDFCRCAGQNCDRRQACQRHVDMDHMGPRTPWTDRYCPVGRESEGYIAVRLEHAQS